MDGSRPSAGLRALPQSRRPRRLEHVDAALSRVIQQDLIEAPPVDMPAGAGEAPRPVAQLGPLHDGRLGPDEPGALDAAEDPHPLEERAYARRERSADVRPRKLASFQHGHGVPHRGELACCRRSRRPTADDAHVHRHALRRASAHWSAPGPGSRICRNRSGWCSRRRT